MSATQPTRTVLVHFNCTVPYSDIYGPDEIATYLCDALEIGSDSDYFRAVFGSSLEAGDTASGNDSPVVCVLAEEII